MELNNKNILKNNGVQTLIASLICILLGLLVGYISLLIINPNGAWDAMAAVLKNFMYFPRPEIAMEYFGSTLAKTAPLLMCTLSVLFAYKAGLFNIGASGQFTVGAGAALYIGIHCGASWWVCMIAAAAGGAFVGAVAGALKACLKVNEVIACILLNWICIYSVNPVLILVKDFGSGCTMALDVNAPNALIPSLGFGKLLFENKYVTIAIPLAIICAILVWIVLEKTRFGYELKATGMSINAAEYCGINTKRNCILTMAISGGLAGLGASFLYLSGIEQWFCAQTDVPAIGFNGIAAAFLGGLHPIASIFAAYFTQHITSGGAYVDKMVYCSQITNLISSIIIYFCGFTLFFKHLINQSMNKKLKNDAEGETK